MMVRRRAFPSGTVGYPMAMARTPAEKRSRENSEAFAASPTMIGGMGVSLLPVLKPSFFSLRLKNFVLDHNFLMRRSPASESSASKAAWQGAAEERSKEARGGEEW